MLVLKTTLKASSLIETLIAMVILVSVFVSGLVVYHKVMSTSVSLQKIKAQHLVQKALDETVEEKSIFDSETLFEDLKIVKIVTTSAWGASLYHVRICVLNAQNDTLHSSQKIVYVED